MAHVVQIVEGKVKGTIKTNLNDEDFHCFLCIPYGKAPVGNLRFKAPQPVEPWQGVKDVTKERNTCFQLNLFSGGYSGCEDCLSLHVFTRKLPNEEAKLKPVMLFIHGGGFMMGSHETNIYGPEYLMTEDIVLVSITYRLGILGFLSLSDPSLDVPGNAGLKDQVLALKWVQRNIKNFNGDPNNVTIFGESAGGASVEFLLLSEASKNLFHKAIMHSGSTLNPWTRGRMNVADFAELLGKSHLSERDLLRSMTEMTVKELYNAQMKYVRSNKEPGVIGIIGPVIEQPNPTQFLIKKPIDIIKSGVYNTVPVITGYNDAEGLLFDVLHRIGQKDIPVEKMLPYETNYKDAEQVKRMSEKIKRFYLSEANLNKKIMMKTDAFFVAGILTSARNQAKVSKNPVYLYRFTLVAGLNFLRNIGGLDFPGACHADELGYLFKNMLVTEIGEFERIAIQRMLKLWTNFAKYGNPTPKGNDLCINWKPIENDQMHFLNIDRELKMGVNPEEDRMKLWNEVYKVNPLTAKY